MRRFKRTIMATAATIISLSSLMLLFSFSASGSRFRYRFNATPVSKALSRLVKDHPEEKITFIYNELDDYTTSADVNTDNVLEAVRGIIGLNPITVTDKKGHIFVEALQRGKYVYRGRTVNEYHEPVPYATVLLLSPKDSTVITYGITKPDGMFIIPCDRKDVIAKISSTGYRTYYRRCTTATLGDVELQTLAVELKNITVEADEARMLSDRTIFVPLQRQKNTSMSGTELLERMAIPQLRFNPQTGVPETNSGKPVSMFIDFIPASAEDLKGMNMQDVKRVEYLEFPVDQRFGGKPYVVNFIMAKYEYGGYFKTFVNENFIMNSGMVQENARFQYKKMTYDLMGLGFYHNNDHYGNSTTETYRLPQADGTVKEFDRHSNTVSSKLRRQQYIASFKATYNSDKITAQNLLKGSLNRDPHSDSEGTVDYSPSDFPNSSYTSLGSNSSKFLQFSGNYHFILPKENSISFVPTYSFSHTEQNSTYTEKGFEPIYNSASDNTNQFSARLSFMHEFGKYGSLSAYTDGSYDYNRTRYYGTAESLDRSKSVRISAGADYSVSIGDFYGSARFGWTWDDLKMNDVKSRQSSPFGNISLQYLINKRHRISGSFRYSTWAPSPSFKSENIIRSNHLMSYTGNPSLVPSKTFGVDLDYSWIPSNRFSLTVFGGIWSVKDRYVYDYEATADGILRTIKQPLGDYMIGNYGVSASASFFGRNLRISGSLYQYFAHNGAPYNYTRFPVIFALRVNYYLGDFYFNASYSSENHYSDGYMVGTWMEYKDSYRISAGWANSKWNLRATANNFARWNWRSHRAWFRSKWYDSSDMVSDVDSHAYFTLSATFTFGYGKKVRSDGEPGGGGSASSGILKK